MEASSERHISRPVKPSAGLMVPKNVPLVVFSHHRQVVNLKAGDRWGTYLVSLVLRWEDWTELSIMTDAPLWRAARSRRVGTRAEDLTATVARNGEPTTRHDLPLPSAREISPEAIERLRSVLTTYHGKSGFVPLVAEDDGTARADPFVRRATKILERSYDGTVGSLCALVGLGTGFTPSGDDFVSGALLAHRLETGQALPVEVRTRILERVGSTTAGGAALLRVAVAGYPPWYQLRIAGLLADGHIDAVVETASKHGHSSGLDALTGLIWWLTRPRRHDAV